MAGYETKRDRSRSPENRGYSSYRGGPKNGFDRYSTSNPYSVLDTRNFGYGMNRMDQNIRPGDWPCMACGANNFARNRTECFRCKEKKPAGPPPVGAGMYGMPPPHMLRNGALDGQRQEVRPNDWECQDCNCSNFENRTECHKCQKPKPENATLTINLKNWECEKCFASNHSRRNECFKCQSAKAEDAKVVESLVDWSCSSCHAMNAARRTNCITCDAARPGRERELSANPDWKCGGCGIMNWSWRRACYKCFADKHSE